MSAGIVQNSMDTAMVPMDATADYAALLFDRNTTYNVQCRLSGTDTVTGDGVAATLTVGVEVKAGVLTMSPVAVVLPYFAPAFPLAAITLVAGTDRILVRVTGNAAYAGQVVDLDVLWSVWEEGL